MRPADGGGGGTTFGETQAYRDIMDAWRNGGTASLTSKNGYFSHWTNTTEESGILTNHKEKINDGTLNWYGPGGKGNWFLATAAASMENFSGIARAGSNWKIYQATQTGRVFYGNQYVKTFSIGRTGNLAGKGSFGLGLAMDVRSMLVYKNDPTSSNAVHPAKAGLNTTIGAIGVWAVLRGGSEYILFRSRCFLSWRMGEVQ